MSETSIRQALERMQIPSSLIAGVVETAGKVTVVLQAAPGKAKALEPVARQIEGELKVQVVITADAQPVKAGPRPVAPQVKAIIAVASGKGGVGKSTVTANLAAAAMKQGLKVGILDADIYGPSQPMLWGLHAGPPPLDDDKRMIPPLVQGIKLMSIGFMLDASKALVWRGPMVGAAVNQMLRDVAWGELDVLFVDMPPGTGDAQLTLAQQAPLKGAVIVSTPQDLALIDARRAVAMFGQVNVPVLGIIENMSVYHCPNCGHEAHIFGHGGARDEAHKLGVPFLGGVPLELAVRVAGDEGLPIVLSQPDSAVSKTYMQIVGGLKALH